MILSHEDLSATERSLGPEKAAPIINAFEKIECEQKLELKKDLLLEIATKADIAELRTSTKADIASLRTEVVEVRGEIKRLETLIEVLIGLVVVAMSLFSPVGTELIRLLK